MEKITTVGLDLAKQVMAAHAVDSGGRMVTRKVVRRDQLLRWTATLPQRVVAMEACGGAHYWARELTRQGHTVRNIAAEFVAITSPIRRFGARCGRPCAMQGSRSPRLRTRCAIPSRPFAGVGLRYSNCEELLGHTDVSTTMIYTHVLNRGGRGVVSPLDGG